MLAPSPSGGRSPEAKEDVRLRAWIPKEALNGSVRDQNLRRSQNVSPCRRGPDFNPEHPGFDRLSSPIESRMESAGMSAVCPNHPLLKTAKTLWSVRERQNRAQIGASCGAQDEGELPQVGSAAISALRSERLFSGIFGSSDTPYRLMYRGVRASARNVFAVLVVAAEINEGNQFRPSPQNRSTCKSIHQRR